MDMMASDFIVDVTESDFEYQVLAYSQKVPVVVDFWASWCVPCKVLGPILEKLALEGQGSFRLARLDVDANQNLAMRFNVRSIPSVKAFRDGVVVSEFNGALPEPRVRDFIRAIAPAKDDLMIEKGLSLLRLHQPEKAEATFRQVLDDLPGNPPASLGLAKSLLYQGESKQSLEILHSFPASREFNNATVLLPLATALEKDAARDPMDIEDTLEAAYQNALRLFKRGNLEAATDGLLDIMRQDKRYRNGEIHKIILGILELISTDEENARQYRNELASILF
jgi:putative thioredoxin